MTTEDFIRRAKEVHGDKYDYSKTKYVNKRTKVIITCPIHGDFEQCPSNHWRGQGCPMCGKETAAEHSREKRITKEVFIKNVDEKFHGRFSFPKIDEEYNDKHSKITIVCSRCRREFVSDATAFYNSPYGLCQCEKNDVTYTELRELVGLENLIPFGGLRNKSNDTVNLYCEKHGEYRASIPSIIRGHYSCRKCALDNFRKGTTREEFQKKFEDTHFGETINPCYDEYDGIGKNIHFTCKICGKTFLRKPQMYLNNSLKYPCPICGKENLARQRQKSNEEFIGDFERVYGKGKYELIGEYVGSSSKVEIKCLECGRLFKIEANSFLQGHGCPYHNCNSSIKEKELFEFVHSLCPDAVSNDRTALQGMELDVYVPSRKVAFEYDGIFWHNENNKPNDYHLKKTEECEKRGIRLFHIFEDEWLNKQDIVKSMVRDILGKATECLYARKCNVGYVNHTEGKQFMEENHLQGWCPSQIMIGLFHKGELVSLMSFGKSRHFIGNGKADYELLRFCTKRNLRVVGGASKLFKFFINNYPCKTIVSYADRRWSNGNLYDKLGFELYNRSKPNYFYVIKGERKNRFNFRKSILVKKYGCPDSMSEKEFCRQQKWYRIYDCGCLCYRWAAKNLAFFEK